MFYTTLCNKIIEFLNLIVKFSLVRFLTCTNTNTRHFKANAFYTLSSFKKKQSFMSKPLTNNKIQCTFNAEICRTVHTKLDNLFSCTYTCRKLNYVCFSLRHPSSIQQNICSGNSIDSTASVHNLYIKRTHNVHYVQLCVTHPACLHRNTHSCVMSQLTLCDLFDYDV